MKIKKKFNRKDAFNIIKSLMDEYNITLEKWSSSSCGRAYLKERKIKIPKPNNLDRFFVCLHEIKHIIDQKIKPSCLAEFRCDKFALDFCNKLGWKSEIVNARMKWHVLSRVAMATNRKLKQIPIEIQSYYKDVNFNSWYGKNVFVDLQRIGTRRDLLYWKSIITIN